MSAHAGENRLPGRLLGFFHLENAFNSRFQAISVDWRPIKIHTLGPCNRCPIMRIDITIPVQKGERTLARGHEAFVSDPEIYSALFKLAVDHLGIPSHKRDSFIVNTPEANRYLAEFFALLEEAGWKPFHGSFVPEELKDSRFIVFRRRWYEKNDLDMPEFLTIEGWGSCFGVFECNEIRDGLYVGNVRKTKWKSRIGIAKNYAGLFRRSPQFVNDELKRDLEASDLIGLTLLPVLWDRPEKAKGKFWQLSSSVTMPRCLLPIIDVPNNGIPFRCYDDGSHVFRELVFRRSEVMAMAPFDVALTSKEEDIRVGPDNWRHTVVISQRCRKVFNKLKLTSARLHAVRLEADDWKQTDSNHQKF